MFNPELTKSDDDALVRRSQDGELPAFNMLVQKYHKEALTFALRLLGNRNDAEDVCQTSWLDAWRFIDRCRPESFRPWLLHIVANDCRDEFRRRKHKFEPLSPDLEIKGNTVEDNIEKKEIMNTVQQAMLQLPHDQRLAVTLREFNELSYEEMAGVMHCSLDAVKSRLKRGRLGLRDILQAKGILE